jgi:hypothetical protein
VAEVEAEGLSAGTPKFVKRMEEMKRQRMDARPKKVEVEIAPPPPTGRKQGA